MTNSDPASPGGNHQGRVKTARLQPDAVAAGTRRSAERLEREAATRRTVFVAALAGFVALFGLIAVAGKPAPAASGHEPAPRRDAATSNRVIAEAPIANSDGGATIIRIVAPQPRDTAPHVRTRATS